MVRNAPVQVTAMVIRLILDGVVVVIRPKSLHIPTQNQVETVMIRIKHDGHVLQRRGSANSPGPVPETIARGEM